MNFRSIFFLILISGLCLSGLSRPHNKDIRLNIIKTAKKYLGNKYQYGGTDRAGFDCSGFVMHVYQKNGIQLPRMSKNQYKKGQKISRIKIKPADLVFFKVERNRISHVGIYIGRNSFIHSPSTGKRIRIDSLDNLYWKDKIAGFVTFIK